MAKQSMNSAARTASAIDIRHVLGDLDDVKVTEILALKPTLAELEDVAICMAGDQDILAKSGHHVPATTARIVELLVEQEEEPEM